jgi:trehalose 6-phosphate phosphatase
VPKNDSGCLAPSSPDRPRGESAARARPRPGTPGGRVATVRPTSPLPPERCAFFFDLDGTLVDYAQRPEEVRAGHALLSLLRTVRERSGGALALISGRSISSLDRVTRPERFAASGLHGFERRDANGSLRRHAPPDPSKLAEVRKVMQSLLDAFPSLLLEDKGFALALHFRQAPQLHELVCEAVSGVPDLSAGGLRIQHGHLVTEVVPNSVNKGGALAEFMREAPFQDRLPVFVGDDLTDEPAFEWVNRVGGVSVAVNPCAPTAAGASLASVAAVHSWLGGLLK